MIETIEGGHKVNTSKTIKSKFSKEDFFFQL